MTDARHEPKDGIKSHNKGLEQKEETSVAEWPHREGSTSLLRNTPPYTKKKSIRTQSAALWNSDNAKWGGLGGSLPFGLHAIEARLFF